MKKHIILTFILVSTLQVLLGQTILEDSRGKTSIKDLVGGGIFKLNAKNGNYGFNYTFGNLTVQDGAFGLEVNVKANEGGLAALFDKDNFGSTFSGNINYKRGHVIVPSAGANYDILSFEAGLESSTKFKIFDPNQAFGDQLNETDYRGYNLEVSYNYYFLAGTYQAIFGSSLARKKANNQDDIDEIKIREYQTYSNPSGTTTRYVEEKSINAWSIEYMEDELFSLNADIVLLPPWFSSRTAVHSYFRNDWPDSSSTKSRIGLGLYYTESGGNRTKGIVGLQVESKLGSDVTDRVSFNLVTGFNF